MERWYVLRVSSQKQEEASLSLFGGLCEQEKNIALIESECLKVLEAGYQRICLPWNFVYHSKLQDLMALVLKKPELFVLSVHSHSFFTFINWMDTIPLSLLKKLKKQVLIQVVLTHYDYKLLNKLELKNWKFVITILAYKTVPLRPLSEKLKKRYKFDFHFVSIVKAFLKGKKIHPLIYISFPCSHKKHPQLYNVNVIYDFLKNDFYPPPPYDTYNLSIPKDLKLEPDVKPELHYTVQKAKSKGLLASVVIPVYNGFSELKLTLQHLLEQDLDKKYWEVIVVDDGSLKNSSTALKKIRFFKKINFKFLYLPRLKARTSYKDHRFRAGIARNLGAKWAKGENLLFLDSDILTPPHYVSSACRELKKHPVIQHPRYHLKAEAPQRYQDIIKNKHTFIKSEAYWENFYDSASNWNQKKLPWKYISTNTLCLKAKIFKQIGTFRKNYTCWGFEDTDLGYCLYQNKFPFKLNPIPTYHLFRESEFLNQEDIRKELLGISALSFFHNTHSLSGYQEFAHLIKKLNV